MALIGNILKTAFNIGKGVLGLKVAEATGVPVASVELIFKKAQEIADSDKEIQLAWLEAEKEILGSYAELKTTFEKVLRSIVFHIVKLWACGMVTWSAVTHNALDPKILGACLLIIVGSVGHRIYQHFKGEA